MKLKIKKWRAVAIWKWDLNEDCCGICRQAFDACCPECKMPGDDCPPASGKCGHPLHMHCIEKWLKSENSREQCPLCRQPWQYR